MDPWLESKPASNLLIIIILLLISLPVIGIGLATTRTVLPHDLLEAAAVQIPAITTSASSVTTVFTCASKRFVTAIFEGPSVDLMLSDGRRVTLPEESAGGARYQNSDGSFVFSMRGAVAAIVEDGASTYTDCVTKR
jgi:membrane-bound inhibitor of C-type lysozyme